MLTINFRVEVSLKGQISNEVEYVSISGENYAKIQDQLTRYLDALFPKDKVKSVSARSYPILSIKGDN